MTDLVCLSLDVEEFDAPLERARAISEDDQFRVSREGLERVLAMLKVRRVPVTLFTTVRFAQRFPDLIRDAARTHEIASHAWAHSTFSNDDPLRSREELSRIAGVPVIGFRMPRMAPVDKAALAAAGYRYDASENPVWLPGRYNNFFKPRLPYLTGDLVTIPASATPLLRVPLFWLSFKNFPQWLYRSACAETLAVDGAINTYFHPWEFADLSGFEVPWYAKRIDGERLTDRLGAWIEWIAPRARFATYAAYHARIRARQPSQR